MGLVIPSDEISTSIQSDPPHQQMTPRTARQPISPTGGDPNKPTTSTASNKSTRAKKGAGLTFRKFCPAACKAFRGVYDKHKNDRLFDEDHSVLTNPHAIDNLISAFSRELRKIVDIQKPRYSKSDSESETPEKETSFDSKIREKDKRRLDLNNFVYDVLAGIRARLSSPSASSSSREPESSKPRYDSLTEYIDVFRYLMIEEAISIVVSELESSNFDRAEHVRQNQTFIRIGLDTGPNARMNAFI